MEPRLIPRLSDSERALLESAQQKAHYLDTSRSPQDQPVVVGEQTSADGTRARVTSQGGVPVLSMLIIRP